MPLGLGFLLPPLTSCTNATRGCCAAKLVPRTKAFLQPPRQLHWGFAQGRQLRGITTRPRTITTMAPPAAGSPAAKKPAAEPRPSASILLISPLNQILLLHRVTTSSSFPSAHVFPGGNLSASQDGDIPLPSSPARHIDGPAYRLGAIRECFEESGILLARARGGDGGMLEVPAAERERARRAVHAGTLRFADWVAQMGGVLDAEALVPFTRWVTPTNMPKRFTTQMYVYFWPLPLPAAAPAAGVAQLPLSSAAVIPAPTSDGGVEHTAALFQSCAAWLAQARRNEIILFPPQFYLMWLLGHFLRGAKAGGSGTTVAELQGQRERAVGFMAGGGGNGVRWGDKVMSPTSMGMVGGRAALSIGGPGPELRGSGRRGEDGDVVLVRFSKEGPRDVEVVKAEEARRLLGDAQVKL